MAINSEKLISRGFEVAAEFSSEERWKLTSNYSFVQIRGKDSKSYFGYAPRSKADFQAPWYFPYGYESALRVNWSDKFKRSNFDSRPELNGSLTTDLTLHKKDFLPNSELVVSVLNIFDKSYRYPSLFLSNDLPQAGRNFYLGIQIRL